MIRPKWLTVSVWMILFGFLLLADREGAAQNSRLLSPAASQEDASDVVSVRTAWSVDRARPGDSLACAVVLDIAAGYHINADSGQIKPIVDFKPYPTRVTITAVSKGITIEPPLYPQAHPVKVEFTRDPLMAFDGRTIVYVPMTLEKKALPEKVQVNVTISYQACDNQVCLFPRQVVTTADLPVGLSGEAPQAVNQDLFVGYRLAAATGAGNSVGFSLFGWNFAINTATGFGFFLLLFTAALGGMLLNLTPCVLPLIPIKIISLSNAVQNQARCIALGLAMFLGVLFFWLILGAAIALVSGFTATNQLFQYPLFTIAVGFIIAVMAIGMCGLFSIRLPSFVYRLSPKQETLGGSFGLGILTAVLSTPCTAPFMGAAAAWAAAQHPFTTLTVFAAIGIGMALPYLLLSAFPDQICKIPRTGPASVLVKQVMGLFMLAAAAYFIGTGVSALLMTPPSPPGKGYWWAVMGFIALGGLWLAYRTIRIASKNFQRLLFVSLGAILVAGSLYGGMRLTDRGPIDWIYYTPQRFQQAIDQRKIVVMVFSAEWCLNCKALEQSVLNSAPVVEQLTREDVAPIKVDITGNNPQGKTKLQEIGHLTIPLLVVYSPAGREVFRSDFYTVAQILAAVEKARAESVAPAARGD
ncbi:MAG: cytochrome c biogenesis protein CcdA [Desulfobacterales bacterium]